MMHTPSWQVNPITPALKSVSGHAFIYDCALEVYIYYTLYFGPRLKRDSLLDWIWEVHVDVPLLGFHLWCYSIGSFIMFMKCSTLYGWWLLEEGTSRNVPIAGFEMILREDYKSRDEVEGLIIFPQYHFKKKTKILGTFRDVPDNKVAICYIVWLPIAFPGFCRTCRNFLSVFFFPSGDFL